MKYVVAVTGVVLLFFILSTQKVNGVVTEKKMEVVAYYSEYDAPNCEATGEVVTHWRINLIPPGVTESRTQHGPYLCTKGYRTIVVAGYTFSGVSAGVYNSLDVGDPVMVTVVGGIFGPFLGY